MNKKTTRHSIFILTLFCQFVFCSWSYGQSNDLQVVSTNGGHVETPQLSMSWTIGEISVSTEGNSSLFMTQGFQQSFPLLLVLPVELLDFTAQKKDKTVDLNWQTASEKDNAGFELERSSDTEDWARIGFVESQGNSNGLQEYSHLDIAPLSGNNYYRLKQIDLDGQFEYSTIRHVLFIEDNTVALSVYPNPSSGQFTISINNPNRAEAIVQLFTSSGSLFWKQNFSVGEMPEHWEKEFTLEQMEMFFIVSQVGEEISTEKVAVIKKD